jgi:hypothetical protein
MSNLNSQIVDIINNFLQENKLVDARTCEGEFLGMHSSLTVGGAHEVVEELEKLIAQQVKEAVDHEKLLRAKAITKASKNGIEGGLRMAQYGTDEGSKEERFIDNLIRQEQK